jgi:citrate synthase
MPACAGISGCRSAEWSAAASASTVPIITSTEPPGIASIRSAMSALHHGENPAVSLSGAKK